MEQFKVVKINTGSAVHLAEYFKTPHGIEGHEVYCGSGKTGFRNVQRSAGKFDPSKITCKKCKKRWEELQKMQAEGRTNEASCLTHFEKADEELSLKEYVAKYGKSQIIKK